MSIPKKILLAALLCIAFIAGAQTREQLLFNDGWKFSLGDKSGAEKPAFNDATWTPITIPHDYSIEQPFGKQWASATGYLPGGIGWYRKSFIAAASWKNKKVFIDFDGVYNNGEVWINGHYLGKRPNGFVPFWYDLTPYISFSGENVIAVKADHSKFADSRWYTGSGIYRDVHLTIVNPSHIEKWGVAFHADVINTSLAKGYVTVNIDGAKGKKTSLQLTLKDPSGKIAASVKKDLPASANNALLKFDINQPVLWSVDQPSLYSLELKLMTNGAVTDEWKDEVGVRSFHFDPDKGFSLNGQSMKLKGVCVHDDAGVLGVAVPEEVWVRRLAILKAGGVNSIRMAHNPHAEYLYRLCDKMGFLVMDEAFDEWEEGKNKWISGWNKGTPGKDGYHEYFKEWAVKDVETMVLRNRNRPSIIMWSIGNEIDYPNDPYSHEVLNTGRNPQIYGKGYLPDHPPASRLGTLSAVLAKAVKRIDTTRPVTAALAGVVMSNTTDYPANLDLVGYNYQEYRYDSDHVAYPRRIIYGSENGMQYNNWLAVAEKDFISAQYLWTGIDYMGEAGQWPSRSNGAGLLTLGGFPKPEYYFRQSLWSDSAVLYVGTSPLIRTENNGNWSQKRAEPTWNKKDGDSVTIRCFSNCDEVEVLVNGVSQGRQLRASLPGGIFNWNTVFTPGKVEARGYRKGLLVKTATLHTTGAAAAIAVNVYSHPLIQKRDALVQLEAAIIDSEGNRLYRPGNELTVKVEGAARFVGMENSHLADTSDYRAAVKPVVNGPVIIYVKPDGSNRPFKVSISSPGLPSFVKEF